jgi:hypothetical protein
MSKGHPYSYDVDIMNNWKDMFDKTAKEPIVWLIQAKRLKLAAEIIYLEMGKGIQAVQTQANPTETDFLKSWLSPIYLMLLGYSLECMLKGIYIKYKKDSINDGQLERWPGNGHGLDTLVDAINAIPELENKIGLVRSETHFLHRLTEYTVWAGKYPVPKNFKDNMPRETPDGGAAPLTYMSSKDQSLFEVLFHKLSTYY